MKIYFNLLKAVCGDAMGFLVGNSENVEYGIVDKLSANLFNIVSIVMIIAGIMISVSETLCKKAQYTPIYINRRVHTNLIRPNYWGQPLYLCTNNLGCISCSLCCYHYSFKQICLGRYECLKFYLHSANYSIFSLRNVSLLFSFQCNFWHQFSHEL